MCTDTMRRRCLAPAVHLAVCLFVLAAASCAKRVPPAALPAVLAHPEFVYPALPAALEAAPGASRIDIGWRYLQAGDLTNAGLEFGVALKLGPRLYPARAGQGYVAMAMRDYDRALTAFDAALQADARYAPALVGRGQALLALNRTAPALAAFEAALAADPSLTEVSRRIDVLRFRSLQDVIDAAREAAAAGRVDEARRAYGRALEDSPQSAFLHRELGLFEKRAGDPDRALDELRRAADLDPSDAASIVAMGELLEARGDPVGAEAAFRRAVAIDPGLDLSARIAGVAKRAREARLPTEFQAALVAPQITRGDLAALLGVRLDELIRRAPVRQVVVTDTAGHWAAEWITQTASASVIDPFENHTFQPNALVRRGDLARVVSRLVGLIASDDPAVRERLAQRPVIADLTPGHLQYDAVVTAVAAGVMGFAEGDQFQVGRQVSGEEAVEVIDRVGVLAAAMLRATRP
jgi:tetratricopeptide (TPR) repeat protein